MSDRSNLFFPLCIDGGLGSGLRDGAYAIRDYLAPRMSFEEASAGELCDPRVERGIAGYAAIRARLERASALLENVAPERLFTIGGGCGVEVPIVSYLARRHSGLRVLWLDAHGDLNSPASSPSGHFHGMPLRFLLEGSLDEVIGPRAATLAPAEVALIGCRDLDPPEVEYIRERGIALIAPRDAATADPFPGESPIYIHLDLDVLAGGLADELLLETGDELTGAELEHVVVAGAALERLAVELAEKVDVGEVAALRGAFNIFELAEAILEDGELAVDCRRVGLGFFLADLDAVEVADDGDRTHRNGQLKLERLALVP